MKILSIMLSPVYVFSVAALCMLSAAALFHEENYLVGYPYAAGAIGLFCVGMMAIILKKVTALLDKINVKMDKSEALCKEGVKEMDAILTKMYQSLKPADCPDYSKIKEGLEKAKLTADRAAVLCEEIKQEILNQQ